MGITIKGSINGIDQSKTTETVSPVRREKPVEQRSIREAIQSNNNQPKIVRSHARQRNTNDSYLIVDGKEKKIGRQSKYLVDMLTIEE